MNKGEPPFQNGAFDKAPKSKIEHGEGNGARDEENHYHTIKALE